MTQEEINLFTIGAERVWPPLTVLNGDAETMLRTIPDDTVHCCVTSPPYYGLRDYGHPGQIGLEPTPAEYVARLVDVFREVRRVLRNDGTLWLNLGDSYGSSGGDTFTGFNERYSGTGIDGKQSDIGKNAASAGARERSIGLRPKNLLGIPWRVAFALQADGWYLRQDIIWHKPNPMPESVRDRCTKAHEYIFLLSKSERYFFDADAIKEPVAESSVARLMQPTIHEQAGSNRVPGKTNGNMKAVGTTDKRNRRSVWTVTTKPFSGAHFATFPPDLIKPCILAGTRPGDTVLDPFGGSGTTAQVAIELGRKAMLVELNPAYVDLINQRTRITPGLPIQ